MSDVQDAEVAYFISFAILHTADYNNEKIFQKHVF